MEKITEKLGVPDNIYEISKKIFKGLVDSLRSVDGDEFRIGDDNQYESEIHIEIDDKIGDLYIRDAKITLKLIIVDREDLVNREEKAEYIIVKGSQADRISRDIPNKKLVIEPTNTVNLHIVIACLESGWEMDSIDGNDRFVKYRKINNLINFISNEKNKKLIQILTHEVMHLYDGSKSSKRDMLSTSKYMSYTNTRFPIPAINDFIFSMYYITSVENMVRMSEVYADIKNNNITKDKFIEFLDSSDVYNQLRKINKITISSFRNEIKKDMDAVDDLLDNVLPPDVKLNSDDEKVDEILRITYINLVNNQLEIYKSFIEQDPFLKFMGFMGNGDVNEEEIFNDIFKKLTKYENNIDGFYKDVVRTFRLVTSKYLKRIPKLYDLVMDPGYNNKSKSYNLHNKINRRGEKFESKIITSFSLFIENKKI